MKKYPKLRRPSHSSTDGLFSGDSADLVITEKCDGNNFRATMTDEGLLFGSRNTKLGTDPDDIGGMFDDVTDYLTEQIDPDVWAQCLGDAEFTIFGENAVEHTISEYDWHEMPQFQLFDVWVEPAADDEDPHWLPWDEVCTVSEVLGLETVPVIERTTVGEFDLDEFDVPESVYRTDDGVAEGVVIRNTETGQTAKIISEAFAERHGEAKSETHQQTNDDYWLVVDKYVTERRIEKCIGKLIEDPSTDYTEPEMEMMEDLHTLVWQDAWSEAYEEIIFESWTVDLEEGHSAAASKAASHLREIMRSEETPVAVVETSTGRTPGDNIEADA